jgi:hypothetical protein
LFGSTWLENFCENITGDGVELNPSITTYLADEAGKIAKELLFGEAFLSDIKFKVGEVTLPAHRSIISSRSAYVRSLIDGQFAESKKPVVKLNYPDSDSWKAVMEFLYTDHAPIGLDEDDCDPMPVLELANEYGLPRLISLCELYVTKMVEVATQVRYYHIS